MKLLESATLVQFFLYEKQDLTIGRNTAFLGPNGTGKTALLDAIQAVMLAADAHRTHFNAQADGKKRSRTLRDYCLGVFDQSDEGRCRDVANTYVALVFRDETTGQVVTAGIALSATAQSPDAIVQGLFILPGVVVNSASFLEQGDGGSQVLPWKRFQAQAANWCRNAGSIGTAVFTTNREDFTRRLLVEHLAAPGDRPNPQAFRNAFQRSLQLKGMDDLSVALRDHLIEARPTNVREFRLRLDQFRQVRDVVRLTKEKIDQASGVCGKYDVVRRERIAEANYACLRAVYDSERLGDAMAEASDTVTTLAVELDRAQSEHRRAQAAFEAADAAKERAIAALNQDPDYARQAGSAQHLGDRQKDLAHKQRALRASVQAMTAAVRTAGGVPALVDKRGLFEEALAQLAQLDGSLAQDAGTAPDTVSVTSALRQVELAYQAVRRALAAAEAEYKDAEARRKDAALALERSKRGLAELHPEVGRLQRELAEVGIDCTPVCDLVRISAPAWQPMIEAYLGPHVQALLVPRGKEIAAVRVYDGLRGNQAVYGVKLALPSRLRPYRAPAGGHPAALLVDGENEDAVTYLRGELGSVMCVESLPELVSGQKGFTRTGMIATGSGVERRRLASAEHLRIGRTDSQAQRRKAQVEFEESSRLAAARKADEQALQGALLQLTPFGNVQVSQADIEQRLAEIAAGRAVVQDLTERLADTATAGTRSLQDAVAAARLAAVEAKRQESEGLERVTTLKQRCETSQRTVSELTGHLEIAAGTERMARQDALYDAHEVDRHRARLDERYPLVEARMEACETAIQRARSTAASADREAWSLLTAYVANYHLAAEGLDGSWIPAQRFIQHERQRLEETELAARLEESEEAYKRALEIFRTDVAQALLSGFDRVDEQMRGLNLVLKNAPAFSNNERYQFRSRVVDLHRPLYEFLQRVREVGGDDGLFGEAGQVPEAFRELMEGDATSVLLQDGSPLADYRRFFSFDVEISREGKVIGLLSKRFGPGSGGEHRTPLYVIFGAALAAAYGNVQGHNGGGGIMLLDEAFDKMDTQNVRAAAQYLNSLGLQLIMAGPETDQPKLSSFLSVYYDMGRYGGKTIQMDRTVLTDATRELLASDNPMYHPELIEQEMARLAKERADGSEPGNA